ncbi:MAG: hypothetical protein Q7S22_04360 [Candidatus Micrarchaeota archaeon]|nr:hypothetical protein [Candidatus Micrarchaeota archaeon]
MAVTVQVNGLRYKSTTDPKRMLTHAALSELIRSDWEWGTIKNLLPARTATFLECDVGARKAMAWNEGEKKIEIPLPLEDGYYVSDGNPFAIPNGRRSIADDPDALNLVRPQDRGFSRSVVRVGGRDVVVGVGGSIVFGVALVSSESPVASLVSQVSSPDNWTSGARHGVYDPKVGYHNSAGFDGVNSVVIIRGDIRVVGFAHCVTSVAVESGRLEQLEHLLAPETPFLDLLRNATPEQVRVAIDNFLAELAKR